MLLTERRPRLDASSLVERFHPPRRFADVRFDTYRVDEQHPSQERALRVLREFVHAIEAPPVKQSRWRPQRQPAASTKPGLYLDGGFGVGKTHLLASAWYATPVTKSYLTFGELTAFIGFAGMQHAITAFAQNQLICIDEFELDDIANTLMVVSFLRGVMEASTKVRIIVTSNTIPERLGEQRFSTDEFRREIAAIAGYFGELRIDGEDFRTSSAALTAPTTTFASSALHTVSRDSFAELANHLHQVHPSQYGALLDDLDGVVITGLEPITDQEDALLFVQLVDKLYDARIPVAIDGCPIERTFSNAYRNGSYRKKYGRAESRMQAMRTESAGVLHL